MSKYKYEIDQENAVKIWDLENPNDLNAPFIFQPDWPDTTPWASKEEAEDWAQVFIESLENPESEFIPGGSPDTHPAPRPEPVEDTPNDVIEGEIK
jgi:hypothetical protein